MQDSCQSDLVRFLPQDSCKILCKILGKILDRSCKILARLAIARTSNILVRKWTFPYTRHVASIGDTFGRKNHVWAYRGSLPSAHCRNVTKVSEFVVKLPSTSKLYSTNYIAVFIGQVQGVLHTSSFYGTVRWEKSHFCLPSFSANLLCLNVTNAREFVVQLPTVSKLHSTDHVAVFTSLVQWVLHMSSCDGTVRWEKSQFCLPSFSAKVTLPECHQSKGMWSPDDYYQLVTQHLLCCCLSSADHKRFAHTLFRWYSPLGKISFLPTEFLCESDFA